MRFVRSLLDNIIEFEFEYELKPYLGYYTKLIQNIIYLIQKLVIFF